MGAQTFVTLVIHALHLDREATLMLHSLSEMAFKPS